MQIFFQYSSFFFHSIHLIITFSLLSIWSTYFLKSFYFLKTSKIISYSGRLIYLLYLFIFLLCSKSVLGLDKFSKSRKDLESNFGTIVHYKMLNIMVTVVTLLNVTRCVWSTEDGPPAESYRYIQNNVSKYLIQ